MNSRKEKRIKEFGDFQTPSALAETIITKLYSEGVFPSSILEPTCGTGSFVLAAIRKFPDTKIYGFDINIDYLKKLNLEIVELNKEKNVSLEETDFFMKDWKAFISTLTPPILIVGNLPWITSSEQGLLKGNNLPPKQNIHKFSGLDSITGKSNFDISEWMLIKLLEAMNELIGTVAILCKVSVARKIFKYINTHHFSVSEIRIHRIDATTNFNASVDACLLTCHMKLGETTNVCKIFSSLTSVNPSSTLGIINNLLVNDMSSYQELSFLHGKFSIPWRSGIKHDATKIMILKKEGSSYINGQNEVLDLEDTYLFPLLKSTDLFHNKVAQTHRWLIVPQKYIGEETSKIGKLAPKTWAYLNHNRARLEKRGSSIYKGKPPFSVFGVGPYTFTHWKVGVSGLHKQLNFQLIGPIQNKPVVLDDTSYFLPTESKEEALLFYALLQHPIVMKFLNAIVYWKAKRPISQKILQQLNLANITLKANLEYVHEVIEDLDLDIDRKSLEKLYLKYKMAEN
ncbi:MAG: N-6 DNA methylase [Candidatus Hodarchaeales archaeon]